MIKRGAPAWVRPSDSTGSYPETLRPLPAGGHGLQGGILAFVREVHAADDGRQRLEADEFPGLAVRAGRQPYGGDGVFGSKKRLHGFAARFDGEVRAAVRVPF